jgi:hypothetical protein
MPNWWIRFSDKRGGFNSFADTKEAAQAEGDAMGAVIEVLPLPYPSREGHPNGCPPFCYTPERCAGRTSCPKSYACSE